MTTGQVLRPAPPRAGSHRRPAPLHAERAAARLAGRQIWIGGLVLIAGTGMLYWFGTVAFHKSQRTGGGLMTAMADIPAMRSIYGLPTAIGTLGGFAVWRVQFFVMLITTAWMVLATTGVLRGNEETGRLELVLAGPLSNARVTVVSLLMMLLIPALTAAAAGGTLQGLGAPAGGSWLYAAGIALLMATFVAIAALTAQIVPERRRAAGIGMAVLLVLFAIRMWADGNGPSAWARWATPFGWVEQLRAFGGNDLLPLVPLIAAPLALMAAALLLVRVRDTGAGLISAAETGRGGTRLLSGALAFATRRRLGEVAAWGAAMLLLGILSGGLAKSYVGFPQRQPQAMQLLTQLGMGVVVTPRGFIAIMNVLYSLVLVGYAIACVHAWFDDEKADRLDLPYSNRVSRTGWAGSVLVTVLIALAVLTAVLALGTWAGSAMAGAGLTAADCFESAANVLPVAVMFFGLAILLHGVWPPAAAWVPGGLAIAALLIQVIGPALSWPNWVRDLSPFYHLALVPAVPVRWTPIWVLLGIGVLAAAGGVVAYAHRDLR